LGVTMHSLSRRGYFDAEEIGPHIQAACEQWQVPADTVVVAHGSRVEGFANASSDVDFYIIALGSSAPIVPVFSWDGTYHLQPEVVSAETLKRLADQFNPLSGYEPSLISKNKELNIYYRFANSVVLANPAEAEELRTSFPLQHARTLIEGANAVRAWTEMEKARIFIADLDAREALRSIRRGLEFGLDSFLARHGEAFPNQKWRFAKLERAFGVNSELYKEAWSLKSRPHSDPTSYYSDIEGFLARLEVSAEPAKVSYESLADVEAFKVGGQDYLYARALSLYSLTPLERQVWDIMTASQKTRPEIIEALQAGIDDAENLLVRCIASMRALGLITLRPILDTVHD
jgi:hypothetical protein